jgi:DNA-binding CsgD family transcriptional regulator/Tfp pilus assembly protein PilF
MCPVPAGFLLERERELEMLGLHLDRARKGAGSLLVVEGPPGIGKTALVRAAGELARERGMTVLEARGGVLEQELEYGVTRQLVEKPVVRAGAARRAQLLAGPAAAAATALGMGELPADHGPGGDPSPEIRHGLHWLFANLAEEAPLLIAVDDAHWGDAASLRALAYLARRLEGLAVTLLLATRGEEPGSQQALLAELVAAAEGPGFLRPEPLAAPAVASVLRGAFGEREPPAELVEACRRATGGNPFLITELAGELAAGNEDPAATPVAVVDSIGPVAVRRSLLLRLGNLGPAARRLARAVAIMGGEAELRHAAAVAGLAAEEAGGAADMLTATGILERGMPLRMVHPLVRAAIAEDMPPSERAAGHRRAFEVLADEAALEQALLPHALAAAAARDPRLVELLRRLAERALRTGTPDAAATYLERALREPPAEAERGATLAELGRAQVRAGRFDQGLARLEQALALTAAPGTRSLVHRERAFAAFAGAGMGEARRIVAEAVADLEGEGDEVLQLEADLALLAWLSGGEHGLDLRRHGSLAGATRAERTLLALLAQEEHATGAPPDAVVAFANRALAGGRLVAEDTSEALSWYMATYALLTCEAHEEARATIAAALADGHRRGSAFARAGALGTRAVLALNEGRPRDAEADAREAAAATMPPIMVPVNAAYLVMALVDQGELEEAERELAAAGIDQGPGGPTVLRWVPWGRARLREAQGRVADVRDAVAPLREDDEAGRPMRALAWRALLSRTLVRAGGDGEAAAEAALLAERHLDWARGWGRPGALGVALRAHALVPGGGEGRGGTSKARIERLEEAAEALARSPLRTEEARARLDLGVAQLRDGRRRDGRATLEAALELALAADARGTARAAAEELEIAGAPPRRLSFDELTASERRIAEHAAAGRTNREIAAELFVTPKTVENHLTRVYGKLGIGSRRELPALL